MANTIEESHPSTAQEVLLVSVAWCFSHL